MPRGLVKYRSENVERKIEELCRGLTGKPNGELADLEREIRDYETRAGVDSHQMLTELRSGVRPETSEIASWIILLNLRARVTGQPCA